MPRAARVAPGGMIYHVINRANGRLKLFKKPEDFQDFYGVIHRAQERFPLTILGWCLMHDHWHFVVKPKKEGDLSRFFGYLTLTHAARRQSAHKSIGEGHVYQGRFKSFMIQEGDSLKQVLRFVEQTPTRGKVAKKAEAWKWSSLHVRLNGPKELQALLAGSPISRPRDWVREVNRPLTSEDEGTILTSLNRSRPFGDPAWVARTVERYELFSTVRPRGRQPGWRKPTKSTKKSPKAPKRKAKR